MSKMSKEEFLKICEEKYDTGKIGEISDGYHTFDELYDHRAKLFAGIVNLIPDVCWKSKKHYDGTMFDGMFIVGMMTPEGQATYHYDIDPYWDLFHCAEFQNAPEFDGHTPSDAIERIVNWTEGMGRLIAYEHAMHEICRLSEDPASVLRSQMFVANNKQKYHELRKQRNAIRKQRNDIADDIFDMLHTRRGE